MVTIDRYKTYVDYPEANGFYKILYPLRDAISVINPFFVVLFGFMIMLTVSSYFAYISLTGKERFFNCLIASSFSTFIISIFFSLGELVSPYVVLFFIGTTVLTFILSIYYK